MSQAHTVLMNKDTASEKKRDDWLSKEFIWRRGKRSAWTDLCDLWWNSKCCMKTSRNGGFIEGHAIFKYCIQTLMRLKAQSWLWGQSEQVELKESSPKPEENPVIIYSPLCCFELVWPSVFCRKLKETLDRYTVSHFQCIWKRHSAQFNVLCFIKERYTGW